MKSTMLNNYINYYQITKVSFFISSECYHLDFFVSRIWFFVQLAVQCSVRIFVHHCRVHRCRFVILIDRSRRLKWCIIAVANAKLFNGTNEIYENYISLGAHISRLIGLRLDFKWPWQNHGRVQDRTLQGKRKRPREYCHQKNIPK